MEQQYCESPASADNRVSNNWNLSTLRNIASGRYMNHYCHNEDNLFEENLFGPLMLAFGTLLQATPIKPQSSISS